MEPRVFKGKKMLRCGFTTGSCAAAAVYAAAEMQFCECAPKVVNLSVPKGIVLCLPIENSYRLPDGAAVCAVRKDSGDDPDVTNGILIVAAVKKTNGQIYIEGGSGVGRVTREGLSLPLGEAAINPGPRKQIISQLQTVAKKYGYIGGFDVLISAEHGEEIAKSTFNSRLGIEGGISILGTSGIVEPMSEEALVQTIRLELDGLKCRGIRRVLVCPGNYGMDFAEQELGLCLEHAVKCSNFIGDTLDYLDYLQFEQVLLVGHAGKLFKIAAGIMQTHSAVADGRREIFAAHAALCGADQETVQKLMNAVTLDGCVDVLKNVGICDAVCLSIGQEMEKRLGSRIGVPVELICFTQKHGVLYRSNGTQELCKALREGT